MKKIIQMVLACLMCFTLTACNEAVKPLPLLDLSHIYKGEHTSIAFRSMNITKEIAPTNQNIEFYVANCNDDQMMVDTTFYVKNDSKQKLDLQKVLKVAFESEEEIQVAKAIAVETNMYNDIVNESFLAAKSEAVVHMILYFKEKDLKKVMKTEAKLQVQVYDETYEVALKEHPLEVNSLTKGQGIEVSQQQITIASSQVATMLKPLKESPQSNWYELSDGKHQYVCAHLNVENTSDVDFNLQQQVGLYLQANEQDITPAWIVFLSEDGTKFMNDENYVISAHSKRDIYLIKKVSMLEAMKYSLYITLQGKVYHYSF